MRLPRTEQVGAGPSRRLAIVLFFAFVLLGIVPHYLTVLPQWWADNDLINNLGTGFKVDPNEPVLERVREHAQATCVPSDEYCLQYKNVLVSNTLFTYPLPALFGRTVSLTADFLGEVARVGTVAAWVGLAVAIAIALTFAVAVGEFGLLAVASMVGLAAAARYVLRGQPWAPNPIQTLTLWELVTVAATGCAAAAAAYRMRARWARPVIAWMERDRFPLWVCGATIVALGVGRALTRAPLPLPVAVMALIPFGIVAAAAFRSAGVRARDALLVGFLFVVMAQPEAFELAVLPIPRGQLLTVALVMLPFVLARPNHRGVWLLLMLPVFHVAVAEMIGLALFLTELVACAAQRRLTQLLAASFVLTAASAAVTLTWSGFLDPHASTLLATVAAVLHQPFSPSLILCPIAFGIGVLLLTRGAGRWPATGRVAILVAAAEALKDVSWSLTSAGHGLLEPGLSAVQIAATKLAPQVFSFGIVAIVWEVVWSPLGRQAAADTAKRLRLTLAAVAGLIFAFCATDYTLSPHFIALALRGEFVRDPDMNLLSSADDVYYVRAGRPGDPVAFLSLLKYKVRRHAGLLDPAAAEVVVLPPAKRLPPP